MGSKPGFLSIVVAAAVLRARGTTLVVRVERIMSVMKGDREGSVSLTTFGRGSNWPVENFELFWRPID